MRQVWLDACRLAGINRGHLLVFLSNMPTDQSLLADRVGSGSSRFQQVQMCWCYCCPFQQNGRSSMRRVWCFQNGPQHFKLAIPPCDICHLQFAVSLCPVQVQIQIQVIIQNSPTHQTILQSPTFLISQSLSLSFQKCTQQPMSVRLALKQSYRTGDIVRIN